MIDQHAQKALLSIASSQAGYRTASVPFRNGYGGIHRPIGDDIPIPLRALMSMGMVALDIVRIDAAFNDPRREIWAYSLTDRGAMYAKMLEKNNGDTSGHSR